MHSATGVSVWLRAAAAVALFLLAANIGSAATIFSETRTLLDSQDVVLIDLTLATGGTVTLQTYGFGGGTNAAAIVIPSGGFNPFVGLFLGAGDTALFIDGTSDILSNYSAGCPPAGLLTIGSVPSQCGDVYLEFLGLSAGTYTVLLSDGSYVPTAVFELPPAYLGDGFTDFTAGAFQTCYDLSDCNVDTANWALDITAPDNSSITDTPEPDSAGLTGLGWALAAGLGFARRRSPAAQG